MSIFATETNSIMDMESLNRVELKGTLGNINLTQVGDKKHARFSVATDYAYRNKDGEAVIETTWHNVSAWDDNGKISELKRGDKVHVLGRLRNLRYRTADGEERSAWEVLAHEVKVL